MRPQQYRKKPVVIEAVEWTGDLASMVEFFALSGPCVYDPKYDRIIRDDDPNAIVSPDKGLVAMTGPVGRSTEHGLLIETLEGPLLAQPGDYVIRGVKGEFYPCKPDVFDATYEKVITDDDYDPAPAEFGK